MPANANLTVVQTAYAAFGRADIPAVIGCFAADGSFAIPGDPALFPVRGRFVGPDGLLRFFQTIGATYQVLDFAPETFDCFADKVLVHGHEKLRMVGTGREMTMNWLHLFTIADGRIASVVEWNDGAALLAAFRGL